MAHGLDAAGLHHPPSGVALVSEVIEVLLGNMYGPMVIVTGLLKGYAIGRAAHGTVRIGQVDPGLLPGGSVP